jgi:uncharacterized protein involved in exopolysaccharide biosynthesis
MKRALRAAAWLYPKRWRERYGDEFEALIDDAGADWRSLADVTKGALKMQLSHWGSGRIITVAAVVGVVIAAGISFIIPDQWQSQAVIKITPQQIEESASQDSINQAMYDRIQSIQQTIESRAVLQTIINNFGLYPRERSREPIEDVIEEMKSRIRIVPIASDGGTRGRRTIPAFGVSFSYEDRHKAQQVVQDLVSRFMEANVREPFYAAPLYNAGQRLEILDPPSFPQHALGPNRVAMTGAGLLAGLSGGLILAIALRMRRKSKGICPACGRPLLEPDSRAGLKHA